MAVRGDMQVICPIAVHYDQYDKVDMIIISIGSECKMILVSRIVSIEH